MKNTSSQTLNEVVHVSYLCTAENEYIYVIILDRFVMIYIADTTKYEYCKHNQAMIPHIFRQFFGFSGLGRESLNCFGTYGAQSPPK